MNEEFEHIIPDDADDLSKDAPALFAMKGKDDGFVVPNDYFDSLSDRIHAKTVIPQDGGLTEPLNYFESLGEQLESKINLEALRPQTENDIPEGYFDGIESELSVHIALDNLKQEEGFVVPEGYFTNLTERIVGETVLDKESINNDEVPQGYFESLHDKVVERIASEHQSTAERGRIVVFSVYIKQYARPIAIAASVALMIGLGWFAITNSQEPEINTTVAKNDTLPSVTKSIIPIIGDTLYQKQTPSEIALEVPKTPQQIKPIVTPEVISPEDEIIAQSDLMDESMVMDFIAENEADNTSEEVSDESMMDYLMNDNTSLDVIDPGNK